MKNIITLAMFLLACDVSDEPKSMKIYLHTVGGSSIAKQESLLDKAAAQVWGTTATVTRRTASRPASAPREHTYMVTFSDHPCLTIGQLNVDAGSLSFARDLDGCAAVAYVNTGNHYQGSESVSSSHACVAHLMGHLYGTAADSNVAGNVMSRRPITRPWATLVQQADLHEAAQWAHAGCPRSRVDLDAIIEAADATNDPIGYMDRVLSDAGWEVGFDR